MVWAIAYFVGFVPWPFVTVALQQATGSFKLAFLCIPVFMLLMALGVWLCVPEHAGKELNKALNLPASQRARVAEARRSPILRNPVFAGKEFISMVPPLTFVTVAPTPIP